MNLAEVAKKAGVSASTVSRALNNPAVVPEGDSPRTAGRDIVIDPELVVRDSAGPAKKRSESKLQREKP